MASPKPPSDGAQLTTKVEGSMRDTSTMHSTITFVDLAGSEPAASHISDAARIKYANSGPLPDEKQRKLEVCSVLQHGHCISRVKELKLNVTCPSATCRVQRSIRAC